MQCTPSAVGARCSALLVQWGPDAVHFTASVQLRTGNLDYRGGGGIYCVHCPRRGIWNGWGVGGVGVRREGVVMATDLNSIHEKCITGKMQWYWIFSIILEL